MSRLALRLVQRFSVLALDVLGFRGDCAGDDGLHLFWYSSDAASQGKRAGPQLCRISVSEFRISYGLCCPSARRAARLVALRSVQRLVLVRNFLPAVFAHTPARGPDPLVALPYLLKWNTVLLGCLLFWFALLSLQPSFSFPSHWRFADLNPTRLAPQLSGAPSAHSRRISRRAPATPKIGSTHPLRGRLSLYGLCSRVECPL